MKKKKRLKLIYNLLMAVCLLVFVVCGIYLFHYYRQAGQTEKNIEQLVNIKEEGKKLPKDEENNILGQYQKLYERNGDMVGWVDIEGTKINYPVMKSKEEQYYLHRNFDKEYDVNGLPFIDANYDLDDRNSNIMIYGHHMKSGIMFAGLLDYDTVDFYDSHKLIHFDTLGEERTYKVIAAFYSQIYRTDERQYFKFYQYAGALSANEYETYVKSIQSLSCYDTGTTAVYGEQLLTLVTCSYHVDEGRFVVVAKRIQ